MMTANAYNTADYLADVLAWEPGPGTVWRILKKTARDTGYTFEFLDRLYIKEFKKTRRYDSAETIVWSAYAQEYYERSTEGRRPERRKLSYRERRNNMIDSIKNCRRMKDIDCLIQETSFDTGISYETLVSAIYGTDGRKDWTLETLVKVVSAAYRLAA